MHPTGFLSHPEQQHSDSNRHGSTASDEGEVFNTLMDIIQAFTACACPDWSSGQSAPLLVLLHLVYFNSAHHREQTHEPEEEASACDIITLKVRSEDGDHTFILKMYFSETIGQLRQYVDKHRYGHALLHLTVSCTRWASSRLLHYRGGGLPNYDIISMYPRRRYDDDRQTLQSCGLTTNTTLRLWKRKHQQ